MSTSQGKTNIYKNEELPFPVPISLINNLSDAVILLFTRCAFYRNQFNSNLELSMPIGPDISPGQIWLSPTTFLPINFFNSTKPITEISFPNANSVQFNQTMQYYHDITVMFKLSLNSNGDHFQNHRELRCRLVGADGITQYDNSMFFYGQPSSEEHFEIHLSGAIQHYAGDIAKLQFSISQDNVHNNQSDTLLTIFNINWSILALKVTS